MRLGAVGPEPAVLEPTGGVEITVAGAAAAAGLPLAVVNPAQVRASSLPGMTGSPWTGGLRPGIARGASFTEGQDP